MKPIFESYREIIPDFSLFQEGLHRPLPSHLRANLLRVEPGLLVRLLREKGVRLQKAHEKYDTLYHAPGFNSAGNLQEYFLGYIHPQALTSCLASIVLSPGESCYVLEIGRAHV